MRQARVRRAHEEIRGEQARDILFQPGVTFRSCKNVLTQRENLPDPVSEPMREQGQIAMRGFRERLEARGGERENRIEPERVCDEMLVQLYFCAEAYAVPVSMFIVDVHMFLFFSFVQCFACV